MKSLSKLLMSFATVVMAFASCEQVVEESVPQNDFVYTFTLGSADETKATIGENSVVWEEGDQMGVYTISTSGTSYNRYGDITPGTPATMEISSYYALAAGDMVYAYYPYTSNNSQEATTVSMSIPTSQDGKDDMPMVSLPIAMASDLAAKTDVNLPAGELKFVNLGAVIEFNLYSTTAEYQSEEIQSVSFVADQAIAGSFTYDLSKVNYSDPATLTISGYEETTVVYTPLTPAPVPAEKASATKIKMVVAPGSYTGKVIVTTNAATYTYNIEAAKEFVRSTIKPLNVELRADVREPNSAADIPVGEQYIYEFSNKSSAANSWNKLLGGTTNSAINIAGFDNKQIEMGTLLWSVSAQGATNIYISGYQIGSSSNYISSFELETNDYSGGVESIELSTCSNAGNTTIQVYVGDEQLGETITLESSSSFSDYRFETQSVLSGTIRILYTIPTSKKNIKISKITIN